jgi:hypothetical protein
VLVGERRGETVPSEFNHPGREVGVQCGKIFKNNWTHQLGKLITLSANVLTQNITNEELPALPPFLKFAIKIFSPLHQ